MIYKILPICYQLILCIYFVSCTSDASVSSKSRQPKCLRYHRNRNLRGVRELDLFPLTNVKECMKLCIQQKGRCKAIISYKYGQEERTCITLNGTSADPGVRLVKEKGAALFEIKNECWSLGKVPVELPKPPAFPPKRPIKKINNEISDSPAAIGPPALSLIVTPIPTKENKIATAVQPPSEPQWSDWGSWARCSSTCGQGTQRRLRLCDQKQPGCGVSRLPAEFQEQECFNEENCGTWYEWSQWSSCSTTCDSGKQQRVRSCSTGHDNDCRLDASTEVRECFVVQCSGPKPVEPEAVAVGTATWGPWSSWAACSVTCGVGRTGRIRICSIPDACQSSDGSKDNLQFQTDSRPCFDQICPENPPSLYNSSSRVPAPPTLPKSHILNDDIDSLATNKPVPQPATTAQVFVSSTEGRSNSNNLSRETVRLEIENDIEDSSGLDSENGSASYVGWLSWLDWSACSASCGTGHKTRRRGCLPNGICLGSPSEWITCETDVPCITLQTIPLSTAHQQQPPIPKVTSLTEAMMRAKIGQPIWVAQRPSIPDSHAFTFPFGKPKLRRNQALAPTPKVTMEYETVEPATGPVKSILYRSGLAAKRLREAFLQRNRKRLGKGSLSQETSMQESVNKQWVKSFAIPVSFEDPDVSYSAQIDSDSEDDSVWGSWQPWAACTVTCGVGLQPRSRQCQLKKGCPTNTGLLLSETVSRYCHRAACISPGFADEPNEWGAWSDCSASCGSGLQIRKRTSCPDCIEPELQHRQCKLEKCVPVTSHWSTWGPWSSCNAVCGSTGVTTRERVCFSIPGNECRGNAIDSKSCISAHALADCSTASGQDFSAVVERLHREEVILEYDDHQSDEIPPTNSEANNLESVATGANLPLLGASDTSFKQFNFTFNTGTEDVVYTDLDIFPGDETSTPLNPFSLELAWMDWGPCSVTCGKGVQSRHKLCDSSRDCDGLPPQLQHCELDVCPCVWQSWSTWSQCSHPCDGGKRVRTSRCSCSGFDPSCKVNRKRESEVCNRRRCRFRNRNTDTRLDLVGFGRRSRASLNQPIDNFT